MFDCCCGSRLKVRLRTFSGNRVLGQVWRWFEGFSDLPFELRRPDRQGLLFLILQDDVHVFIFMRRLCFLNSISLMLVIFHGDGILRKDEVCHKLEVRGTVNTHHGPHVKWDGPCTVWAEDYLKHHLRVKHSLVSLALQTTHIGEANTGMSTNKIWDSACSFFFA